MALRNIIKLGRGYLKPGTRYYSDFFSRTYDPPYLESLKPKLPVYELINVQIKGYDFAIVERYQKVVHQIANTMELEVTDCWAQPLTSAKVTKFKPASSVVSCEYNLNLYERNVQIENLPALVMPTFAELIQTALPQGLQVTLLPHVEQYEEDRYVPDYELVELQTQLEDLSTKKK